MGYGSVPPIPSQPRTCTGVVRSVYAGGTGGVGTRGVPHSYSKRTCTRCVRSTVRGVVRSAVRVWYAQLYAGSTGGVGYTGRTAGSGDRTASVPVRDVYAALYGAWYAQLYGLRGMVVPFLKETIK
jgi:hypothetical protein